MASQGCRGGTALPACASWAGEGVAEPQLPQGCVAVDEVDGSTFCSYREFRDELKEPKDENLNRPIILRNARLKRKLKDFTVEKLAVQCGHRKLPGKSERCAGFFVGDQGTSEVMDIETARWPPNYHLFSFLTDKILSGSSTYYMRMSSQNGACQRDNVRPDTISLAMSESMDSISLLLEDFVLRAPFPCIIPFTAPFAMVFWMGSEGRSFGLHTDLFTEQYFLQNEGHKEVFLMLPEDSNLVAPISFLTSEKYYKSSHRTVRAMDYTGTGCQWALLHPGDVLYIPPMWWHEFRTVSKGPNLSTTVRRHLNQEEKAFLGVVRNFKSLNDRLNARGSNRLTKHVITYFVRGMCLGLPAAEHGYYEGMLRNIFADCRAAKAAVKGDQPRDGGGLADGKESLPVVLQEQQVPSEDGGSLPSTRHPSGEASLLEIASEDFEVTPPEDVHTSELPLDGDNSQWKSPAFEAWCNSSLGPLRLMTTEDGPGGPSCKLASPLEQRALTLQQEVDAAAMPQGATFLGAACDLPMGTVLAGLMAAASGGFVMGLCVGRHVPQ